MTAHGAKSKFARRARTFLPNRTIGPGQTAHTPESPERRPRDRLAIDCNYGGLFQTGNRQRFLGLGGGGRSPVKPVSDAQGSLLTAKRTGNISVFGDFGDKLALIRVRFHDLAGKFPIGEGREINLIEQGNNLFEQGDRTSFVAANRSRSNVLPGWSNASPPSDLALRATGRQDRIWSLEQRCALRELPGVRPGTAAMPPWQK